MIRKAEKDDIVSIKHLLEELTGHKISDSDVTNRLDFVENSNIDFLYVYETERKVIGLFGFRIRENLEENSRFGEISLIVVDSSCRKQGIGKQLLEYAEALAVQNNCIGTCLVSGFGRKEQAHEFYKSLGYKTTGYRFVKSKI